MRTLNYQPCKVCRSSSDSRKVPLAQTDPSTDQILSVDCVDYESMSDDKKKELKLENEAKFDNCEAMIYESGQVMCFKCVEGHYFDGASQTCRVSETHPTLKKCVMSYDNAHCVLCEKEFQMNAIVGECRDKGELVDYDKYAEHLQPGQGQNTVSANSFTVDKESDMFSGAQTMNDDFAYDAYDGEIYRARNLKNYI